MIVSLAGFGATIASEITRDQFTPYAAAGMAEIVYPVGLGESWNAIGCCGYASAHKVDDLGFMKALVAKLDPAIPGTSSSSGTATAPASPTAWPAPPLACSTATGW